MASADSIFQNSLLDVVSTEEFRRKHLNLSLTSYYSIEIKNIKDIWPEEDEKNLQSEINILAYEAVLPGTSLELGQVFGDRQGVTEQYPTKRIYPQIDVSFYVKDDYKIVLFFEKWLEYISPVTGDDGDYSLSTSIFKFNYPNKYERNINIVKYERGGRDLKSILDSRVSQDTNNFGEPTGTTTDPSSLTYSLINAYPVNVISLPVSYDQSSILKTTITFNYDRYVLQHNNKKTGTKTTVQSST